MIRLEPCEIFLKMFYADFYNHCRSSIINLVVIKDQVLKSEQIAKYKQLSSNLILTNYLEWVWLKDGTITKREILCYPNDVGHLKAHLDPDKAEKLVALITTFLSTPPKGIGSAKELALSMAIRCHELRDFLKEELTRQEREVHQ
jgi:hypothetical protein